MLLHLFGFAFGLAIPCRDPAATSRPRRGSRLCLLEVGEYNKKYKVPEIIKILGGRKGEIILIEFEKLDDVKFHPTLGRLLFG